MSILSTLALLTTALVARPRPDRIEELELELEDMKAQRDSARDDAARWSTLANSWRSRYESSERANQAAQYAAMYYQNAQQAQGLAALGLSNNPLAQAQNQLLGAQNLNVGYDNFCNCVPSRAQVWGL